MNCLTLLVKVFLPTDSLTYEEGSLLALFCKGETHNVESNIFRGAQDIPPFPMLPLPPGMSVGCRAASGSCWGKNLPGVQG